MTPIEELCARLDELEIKHKNYGYKSHVWWEGKDSVDWHAENRSSVKDPYVIVDAVITPEQAIAATVGVGTCHVELSHSYETAEGAKWFFELSCHTLNEWPEQEPPSFCPHCGAKVVSE